MRASVLIVLLASFAPGAWAQEAQGAGCNIVTGTLEVDAKGELARPAPTAEQCAAAAALLEKLESMDRKDFRRVLSRDAIPGNVYTSISRYGTFGGPWSPYPLSVPRSDRPEDNEYVVSWLSDKLVIIVSETDGFAGKTTTVVIADLESLQVCNYPNWPVDDDPRTISIGEIQRVLDAGIRGDREIPACHLKPLVID